LKAERYAGPLVLLASFFVYLLTLAPEVTYWDSGELTLGAAALGVPHSPGYPTFCILGKGFSFLPFGNAAYRLNLMSASFAAFTAYLLYLLVRGIGRSSGAGVPVAVSSALAFAFSGLFWGLSVVAEVYTLNTFLLSLIVYLVFLYENDGHPAHLPLSAFLAGLALATHQSAVFLMPAYAGYVLYARGNYRRPVLLLVLLSFALLGFSVTLYLPVRAAAMPSINVGDPSTLDGFKWVMKWDEHVKLAGFMPKRTAQLVGKAGLPAVLAGLAACLAAAWALRKRPYVLFIALSSVTYFLGIIALTAGDVHITRWGLQTKFYVPAILLSVPLVSFALFKLIEPGKRKEGKKARPAAAPVAWVLLAVPVWLLFTGYKSNDNSGNFFAFDFGANTLKSVRQDAALIGWGDNGVFPVWYLQGVERYRDDVMFMSAELMTHYWYTAQMKDVMLRKYGIDYRPPKDLVEQSRYMPVLKFMLESRTPTYFDYSAARQLGVKMENLANQGLVYATDKRHADDIGHIWDRYALRGMLYGPSNEAFVAEGITGIYGYECIIWAQQANAQGRPEEAVKAYEIAKKLGAGDKYLDVWIEKVRKKSGEPRN